VKWASSRRTAAGAKPANPGDGLDLRSWETVCESATAAHGGDASGHAAPLMRFEKESPHDTRVGIYLWYLLRYRVAEMLGR
jgi:hypothetical protein